MKRILSSETFLSALLTGVLLLYGVKLLASLQSLERTHSAQRAEIERNNSLIFEGAHGRDIFGHAVDLEADKKEGTIVAFVVRATQAAQDITFWNAVSHESRVHGVRLVGYCDGQTCAKEARQLAPTFPIVAYGEVISTQAVMNADRNGALLLCAKGRQQRQVTWRAVGVRVEDIFREVAS